MLVPLDPLKLLKLNAKQLANRPCSPPQSPDPSSHQHVEMEFLEFTIKGDPRT